MSTEKEKELEALESGAISTGDGAIEKGGSSTVTGGDAVVVK